jgi:hypothetical protein
MNDDYMFAPIPEALPRDLHFLSGWYSAGEPAPRMDARLPHARIGSRALPNVGDTPTIFTGQVTQERFLASLVADSERFAERARQETPLPDNVVRLSAYRPKKKDS